MDALHAETAAYLDAQRGLLAETTVATHYDQQPALVSRYGPAGRARCLQDAAFHLTYLSEAIAGDSPALFDDYIRWATVMLASRGIPLQDLAVTLSNLRAAVQGLLLPAQAALATTYLNSGIAALAEPAATVPTLLMTTGPLADLAQQYLATLLRYDRSMASRLILDAAARGEPITDLYLQVLQPVQREVGRLWQVNQATVAQEHYCTAATQLIMSQLYPYIFRGERRQRRFVGACVAGDLHELGIRLVSDIMELHGWDSVYLGANTPTPAIIQTLREQPAEVLAISATLPIHVRAVAELVASVRSSLPASRPAIIVGGYAFQHRPDLWRQIGADGYAVDAAEAVEHIDRLVGGGPPQ